MRDLIPLGDIATRVQEEGRAGMGLDRRHTLWQAVAATPDGPGIEVGAYKGCSAKLSAESIRVTGRSPRFFVCDTFQGHTRINAVLETLHHHAPVSARRGA